LGVTRPRPLAESDDRDLFDCGRESLNIWFRRYAWANQASGASRVTILAEIGSERIAGYITLSAAQIERAFLPKTQQRNRPAPLPVTLLGQLAVDKAFQQQGHAASLLFYALTTALVASETIGRIGIITDPLDDNLRGFYARWGSQNLPGDPRRAMIVRMQDLRRSLAGNDGSMLFLDARRTMAEIADCLNVSCKTAANNCTALKQKLGARSSSEPMRMAVDARLA
jgi:predicted N-acetyltransferase YhbS